MDNITAKQTEHGNYTYGYDDLYRLTTAENPIQSDEAFTYDAVGNRLASADTTGNWAYNNNNELVSTPPSSSGSTGGSSFEYDPNGNMVQEIVDGVVTSYVYSVEDRLTEVWDGDVGTGSLIASYYYDPFGRRLWKDVGATRTYFLYSDEGLIGEYDETGAEIKTYGYKPNSTWTTDPLFIKQNNAYYFYHNDHLGTPQKITAMNGAVVWSAKYSSFGEASVDASSTITNNLRFPGQYYDQETGLHYNWFRYYDRGIGRYLTKDPIIEVTETRFPVANIGLKIFTFHPQYFELFSYSGNNPITNIDVYGLAYTPSFLQFCPEGQHRVRDLKGFASCMAKSQTAVVFCTTCGIYGVVAIINPVIAVPGLLVGGAACIICLAEEISCMKENSWCECD